MKQTEDIFEEEKTFAPLPPSFLLSEALEAGNRIIIDTDMESDDTRAIIELFCSIKSIKAQNPLLNIDIAFIVGFGNVTVRLQAVIHLVECLKKDGIINYDIHINYFQGSYTNDSLYEEQIQKFVPQSTIQSTSTLIEYLQCNSAIGDLIFGIEKPITLLECFKQDKNIFQNSKLITYVGGFNYRVESPELQSEVIEYISSFKSVLGISNFVALQNKNNKNPRDITSDNTPELAEFITKSNKYSLEFLKNITTAWNIQTLFSLKNKLENLKYKEAVNIEQITHNTAVDDLISRFNAQGSIFDKTFCQEIAPYVSDLDSDCPQVGFRKAMWYNVVKNFDLQSVIADDLAILTSINNVFLSFEQGNPTYQNVF